VGTAVLTAHFLRFAMAALSASHLSRNVPSDPLAKYSRHGHISIHSTTYEEFKVKY
jgi:hypothetical protein